MHGFEGVICLVLAAAATVIAVRTIVKFRRREKEPPDIGNEMAAAAVAALTDKDGKASYNPLFLYGNADMGKAALLRLIEGKMQTLHIGWEIFPETGGAGGHIENLSKYEAVIIDGLDSLISFPEQQASLASAIQRIYEDGKAIILVSNCSPDRLPVFTENLSTRFETLFIADAAW